MDPAEQPSARVSAPRGVTRERLLDVAEQLLTTTGLGSLTVRELTRQAGVNVATVNYVFGSKDGLLIGLHERMFTPMTAERLRRFDALEQNGDLRVREIVRALVEPLERMRERHGAPALQLYRHLVLNDDERVRAAAWDLLEPGMRRFEELIVAALADQPRDALVRRIALVCQIAVPTTLRALDPFTIDTDEAGLDPLIDLLTGGLETDAGR